MLLMINAVKEELLDYTSFVSFIKDEITNRMGQGYNIRIFKVMKNNALELDSLVVLKEGENFAPNIYLNAYYDSYIAGTSIIDIIDRLCMIYKHCAIPIVQPDFEYTLELMKPYIFFRLISIERNKKLLTQVPHAEFLDLALTFHCLVRSEAEGIGTIRVTNEHIEQWGISCDELKELAEENTKRLFPPIIRTMEEVIEELLYNDEDDESFEYNPKDEDIYPMYILTNKKGINGASCLIYKDVIKEFAQLIKSDLYILPSSIHEIILIPRDGTEDKDRFQRMVVEINSSQVPIEEVLSDKVYMYSLEKDAIIM
ncbi:MAG: hypothetical protein GX129_10390 [Clostridiales bacterium]|jgi:hypothetical protein|nr:hypothetical protein [Clostridiales bacterium]